MLYPLFCVLAASLGFALTMSGANVQPVRPNFVLIVADDLGYGDLGCYGSQVHRTPELDRLAAQGVRFTDFYVPSSVCTPSRVGLLTGRHPLRAGLTALLWPEDTAGLPAGEITLAEALRAAGYRTHLSGKWHVGHRPEHLPHRHGFDGWFGMPYPNDFDANHPRSISKKLSWPPLPLMRADAVVEQPVDVNTLTEKYTADAERFIAEQRKQPFFLYLAHAMPHTWLGASAAFRGSSRNGSYGDAVEELDASVGRIRQALARAGVAERTVIVFTSDNGAVARPASGAVSAAEGRIMFPDDKMGSNAPLRGGKQDVLEGGVRVPGIFHLPGVARRVANRAPASVLDLMPTFLELAGLPLPENRILDGRSLAGALRGSGEREPNDLAFGSDLLVAQRSGSWKLLERRSIRFTDARAPAVDELYDIEMDPGETKNLAAQRPDIVARLKARLAALQREMTAEAVQRGYRPAQKP